MVDSEVREESNMFYKNNLDELALEVYSNSASKGFWDGRLSDKHCLTMIIGEFSEAVEADRKEARTDFIELEEHIKIWKPILIQSGSFYDDNTLFCDWYTKYIKGSVEEEFADIVIRCLDLAGARLFSLNKFFEQELTYDSELLGKINYFTEIVYYGIKVATSDRSTYDKVCYIIYYISALCDSKGIDLTKHVKMKMRYNSHRPHKHGKKY